MYLSNLQNIFKSKLQNIFLKMERSNVLLQHDCELYLSKLLKIFVKIAKRMHLNCKMYLSKLQDCICEDGELVSSATSLALAVGCTIYAMGTIHQHLILFFFFAETSKCNLLRGQPAISPSFHQIDQTCMAIWMAGQNSL